MNRFLLSMLTLILGMLIVVGVSSIPAVAQDTQKKSNVSSKTLDDIEELADIWSENGGRDGFPWWEDSLWRWRQHGIRADELREFTLMYVDQLAQCNRELKDFEPKTQTGTEVRRLLLESSSQRVAALRNFSTFLAERSEKDNDHSIRELNAKLRDFDLLYSDSLASIRSVHETLDEEMKQDKDIRVSESTFE